MNHIEPVAEIKALHHNQPLYSPSIQTIDAILSDSDCNNLDIQQLKLETHRDEVSDLKTKAFFDKQLDDLEERKRRHTELEQVKREPSLLRVGTGLFIVVNMVMFPNPLPKSWSTFYQQLLVTQVVRTNPNCFNPKRRRFSKARAVNQQLLN
jgi:hypothetical protein